MAEYQWLADPHGAVKVTVGGRTYIVVESEWARVSGEASPTEIPRHPSSAFTTDPTPGVWSVAFAAEPDRQEAYVSCVASDPNAVVLVQGGPYGPKPIWPDGPAFVTTDWKGPITIMSPTRSSVRCSGCES